MRFPIAIALLLTGCAHTPEVTLLAGPRRQNNGDRDVAVSILLLQKFGEHVGAGCLHQSEPTHGGPFRSDPEDTADTCGLGLRWGGN